MPRALNKSQRRAFAKVIHFYAHSVGHVWMGLSLSKGPLAEFFNEALTDEERKEMENLRTKLRKNEERLHTFARKLDGFK